MSSPERATSNASDRVERRPDVPRLPPHRRVVTPGHARCLEAVGHAAAGLIREQAGRRDVELNALVQRIVVTDDRVAAAQEMVDRFAKDVVAEDPVLAIWETGTTDAVRGMPIASATSPK